MRLAGLLVSFACLLLVLAACESRPMSTGTADNEPAWISLERTTGGSVVSPVYRVTLFEDGRVLFEGVASVKSKGSFTKTIPREAAAEVFHRIEQVQLWERQRRYDTESANSGGDSVIVKQASTEAAWDIIRAKARNRSVRIDGLFFAPQELVELKKLVERNVGLAEWVGAPDEWKK
jgi:hypothetical protein